MPFGIIPESRSLSSGFPRFGDFVEKVYFRYWKWNDSTRENNINRVNV
jgi:hypothetical protein